MEIENRRQLDLGLVRGLQEARKLRKNRSVVEEGVVEAGRVDDGEVDRALFEAICLALQRFCTS